MKTIYPLIKILILTSLFFIFLDILIGKYIYKKFIRINFKDIDTTYLIEDDVYDHKFKSNYNALVGQGDLRWKFCSDSNGFRTSCEKISADLKEYDIGFIGDSFTEPVGVNYEDSFLYIISQNLPNKEIANLAAQSYSPSIYYAKINYLLSQGYMFNEIIVFIDLSDIVDETVCYTLEKDIVMKRETYSTCFREEYKFKDNLKNFFKHKLRLSYELHNRVKLILTELGFLKYQGLDSNINNRRSDWTHKNNDAKYNNYT